MNGDSAASVGLGGFAPAPVPQFAGVLFVLLGLTLTLSACGESQSDSDTDSSSPRSEASQGSREPFGKEAASGQARQAEAVVANYLNASARGHWERACSYLARSTRRGIEGLLAQLDRAKAEDCPSLLTLTTGELPKPQRRALAGADVTAVRVKGDRGLAFYTDADGGKHSLPIRRENDRWAIARVLTTTNFNRNSPIRSPQ